MSAHPAGRSLLRLRRPKLPTTSTTATTARPARNLRFESQSATSASSTTTTKATQKTSEVAASTGAKAKESAATVQSKAAEGLSRVKSAAEPTVSAAAQGAESAANKATAQGTGWIKSIEAAIPPTVYYSKVGLELSKLIFQGQRMAPPSMSTIQGYFNPVMNAVRNPSSLAKAASSITSISPEALINRVRNVDRAQLAVGGVVFAEVLGFFTVGEMVGRMKLVGYRGEVHHEH